MPAIRAASVRGGQDPIQMYLFAQLAIPLIGLAFCRFRCRLPALG